MLKRTVDLLRATLLSFEMLLFVVLFGFYNYKAEWFYSFGMVIQHFEIVLKTGLLAVYGLILGFCLKHSLAILKPSDSKTREVLAVWGEFFILENRVLVSLVFSSGGVVSAAFGLFLSNVPVPMVAFILIVSFGISIISAISLWRTDYLLQRIVDQAGRPISL